MKLRFRFTSIVLFLGISAFLILFCIVAVRNTQISPHFVSFITNRFEENFGIRISIESVEGDLLGTMAVKNVKAVSNKFPEEIPIFEAEEIRFRYKLLDLFKENFSGWFDIILKRPVIYLDGPFISPQDKHGLKFNLFTGLVQQVRKKTRVLIHDGKIIPFGKEGVISGLEGSFQDKSFDLRISLNHYPLGPFDYTSTLTFQGDLIQDSHLGKFELEGYIKTEGSVVNWKPLPQESLLRYRLTSQQLEIKELSRLNGLNIKGFIGHSENQELDISIDAKDYPLRRMHNIFSFKGTKAIGGLINLEINLQGSLFQPRIFGKMTIHNEDVDEAGVFKNMQMKFDGIYPEVRVFESRMFMEDGSVMRFSDQNIPVMTLFSRSTYKRMIRSTEQTSVTFGDWKLRREDEGDVFSVEHKIGDKINLSYAHSDNENGILQRTEGDDEVALEYELGGMESMRLEVKEDEQFWGLQRKSRF